MLGKDLLLEILLGFKEYLLYMTISAIVFYWLFRRSTFKNYSRKWHFLCVGIGIIFPWVDVVQTWFGIEHEGNLLVRLLVVREYGWLLFVVVHLLLSVLAFYLGWIGKAENNVDERSALAFLAIFLVILVVMNFLLMALYRII